MNGTVFHIQRFSTNDGPGIRTVVFFKGCPLSCAWCHNPESQSREAELFFDLQKCIGCRLCETVCQNGCHVFANGGHSFSRKHCSKCMQCSDICPTKSLERCGKVHTAEEIVCEVLRDEAFFRQSGGGVTLSGGEPLMQYDVSLAILKGVKEKNISTAIETCGFCNRDLSEISKYTDLWLYDIKVASEAEHIQYTGVSNQIILENLRQLDHMGAKIILRCPVIPDVNLHDRHFDRIADIANMLGNAAGIHLEPYHPLGTDKAARLGKRQAYENKAFLSKEDVLPFAEYLQKKTSVAVSIL